MMLAETTVAVLAMLFICTTTYALLSNAIHALKQDDALAEKQYAAFEASEALTTRLLGEHHHVVDEQKLFALCSDWISTKKKLRLSNYNVSLEVSAKKCGEVVNAEVTVKRVALCGREPCVITLSVA